MALGSRWRDQCLDGQDLAPLVEDKGRIRAASGREEEKWWLVSGVLINCVHCLAEPVDEQGERVHKRNSINKYLYNEADSQMTF